MLHVTEKLLTVHHRAYWEIWKKFFGVRDDVKKSLEHILSRLAKIEKKKAAISGYEEK